ncbi:MAG: hypothetical protein KDC49_18820 [Saprospiraceae bacterium]|nr:hypothetical protein [Saprospiraceae bacterium]
MYIFRNTIIGALAGLLIYFLLSIKLCGIKDNGSISQKLLGKWVAVKVEGKHIFNDDSESMTATMPPEGDFIQFTQDKEGDSGIFTTVQYGREENGKWELSAKERIITITYTSFEPSFIMFRRIESISDSDLILTEDGELIKKWVEVNHIMEDSPKKIVGGYLMEQYVRKD